ncbi:MAG: sigma-70 family RNA polymerase sigma factor [Planctomycetota bacterium]
MRDKDLPTAYLLREWQEGDDESLGTLLERHLPWLRRYVRRQMKPSLRVRADTADLVQDAVLELLRYGPRFRISKEVHFRALMARIVVNTLRGKHDWFSAMRRNIARERPLPDGSVLDLDAGTDLSATPSQHIGHQERQAWIRMGLELLEPDDRNVIVFREWEGLSFAEIGRRLELSDDAARKRYKRAVPRLAEVVFALRRGGLPDLLAEELAHQEAG